MRGAPAAADWPHGRRLNSRCAHDASGLLRLVLGGHSRAPWAAVPPRCTTTLQNLCVPQGFFLPRPPRPQFISFPFLCPKFPCQTRLYPPKTVARSLGCGAAPPTPPEILRAPAPMLPLRPGTGRAPRGFLPERGRPARSSYAPASAQQISNSPAPMLPLRPGRPRAGILAPRRSVFTVSLWCSWDLRPHVHGSAAATGDRSRAPGGCHFPNSNTVHGVSRVLVAARTAFTAAAVMGGDCWPNSART